MYATRAELSEVWGVSDSAIKNYAAEASRNLKMDAAELEQDRIAHAAFVREIRDRAATEVNVVTGLPDFAAALKADEMIGKWEGHNLAQRIELTGKDGGPIENVDVSKMTDAELERLAAAAAASPKGGGGTGTP